jgi:hypothetical protein
MTTNSPSPAPEPPAEADGTDKPEKRLPARADKPTLPDRGRDETDVGWGERPEPDDDERLNRDRPPHWSDLTR